jgi:hypothetical protein
MRGPFDVRDATTGADWLTYTRERPGMSTFALKDGVVYHTYSVYARGLDGLWGMSQWLDRAPRGRNEERGPDDPLNFSGVTTSTTGELAERKARRSRPDRLDHGLERPNTAEGFVSPQPLTEHGQAE